MSQHKVQEVVSIDQYDLGWRPTLNELSRGVGETARCNEDAFRHALPSQRSNERLNGLSIDDVLGLVSLGLNENLVEAQAVLINSTVDDVPPILSSVFV